MTVDEFSKKRKNIEEILKSVDFMGEQKRILLEGIAIGLSLDIDCNRNKVKA